MFDKVLLLENWFLNSLDVNNGRVPCSILIFHIVNYIYILVGAIANIHSSEVAP